jgi:hypothetical protein
MACGTNYTVGVDAVDAAGNRSARAQINAATAACASSPPTGSSANVWIDTNGGTCTRSASPVAYSDGAACATLDQAWDAMASGDTARIVAGTYGPQKITGDKTSVTRFIGESKTSVFITGANNCVQEYGSDGAVCAMGNFMWLENVTIDSGSFGNQSASAKVRGGNITFLNVDLWGDHPALTVDGAGSFTWRNGSHGKDGFIPPPMTCSMSIGEPTTLAAPNVTFDNIRFNVKKIQVGAGPTCGSDNTPHLENIRIESAGRDFSLLNSRFVAGSDAGSGHIFSSTSPPGLRVENTIFEPVNGSYAIQMYNTTSTGWVFRNNRFDQGAIIPPGTPTVCGNTGIVPTSWTASC